MKQMNFFKEAMFPLKITLTVLALILSIGSFLGFPHDALLSGMFWAVVCVMAALGVIEYVHSR